MVINPGKIEPTLQRASNFESLLRERRIASPVTHQGYVACHLKTTSVSFPQFVRMILAPLTILTAISHSWELKHDERQSQNYKCLIFGAGMIICPECF